MKRIFAFVIAMFCLSLIADIKITPPPFTSDTTSIARDGSRAPTADTPWNNFSLTSLRGAYFSGGYIGYWDTDRPVNINASSGVGIGGSSGEWGVLCLSEFCTRYVDGLPGTVGLRFAAPTSAGITSFNFWSSNWPQVELFKLEHDATIGVVLSEFLKLDKGRADKRNTTTLDADDIAISPTGKSFIEVSSDSGIASNRTFTLSVGLDGQSMTMCWSGANAGEFLDSGIQKLSANWVPTEYDCISLICDGTDWLELSRSTN